MNAPTPQTTPTRDEAVLITREMADAGAKAIADERKRVGLQYPDTLAVLAYQAMAPLASAPAPASGRVDAEAVKPIVEQIARAICRGRDLNPDCQNQGAARDGTVDGNWPEPRENFGRPYDTRWHYGWRNQVKAAQAVLELLASLSPAATPVSEAGGEAITARYTNWRGETAERTFIPHRVFFGSNEWHPEPQVLIEATDCEKGALRTFAAAGFSPVPEFTYSSTQATKCAGCGEHKHTPLRRDEMGGYVCLTCIDKALAKPASSPAGGDVVREALQAARGFIRGNFTMGVPSSRTNAGKVVDQIDAALSPSTSAAEPVACKVVPIEPDEAILDAMVKGTVADISYEDARDLWREGVEAAALPAPAAVNGQRVKVKPLRWIESPRLGGGVKLIAMDCFGNEFARLDIRQQTPDEIATFKAERQADYEQHIRSSLASTDATEKTDG